MFKISTVHCKRICFNRVIPFHEVTCVRGAKVAGIFPTSIEIFTEENKYFFASFLSREEAFKIINDGWLKNSDQVKSITNQQCHPTNQVEGLQQVQMITLMEGLTRPGVNPLRVHCIKDYSLCLRPLPWRVKTIGAFCRSKFLTMKNSKAFAPINSLVQPLEASKKGHFDNILPSKEVLEVWHDADAVCFDVDSTVCLDEGIDELAEFCGAGKAVAEWTARAMNGSVPFEEALAARLSLFNPSLSQVEDFLQKQPPRISPGIDELVEKLKANNIDVYLISGGFRQMINPVASILGIPLDHIFANQLLFGSSGEFLGFDVNEPTSRSGGKAAAVEQLKNARGYKSLVMIGDGATDLEARNPGGADIFICYAGVQLREGVAAKADWLVFDFKDLINTL